MSVWYEIESNIITKKIQSKTYPTAERNGCWKYKYNVSVTFSTRNSMYSDIHGETFVMYTRYNVTVK